MSLRIYLFVTSIKDAGSRPDYIASKGNVINKEGIGHNNPGGTEENLSQSSRQVNIKFVGYIYIRALQFRQ
jgi:hypothetical protein